MEPIDKKINAAAGAARKEEFTEALVLYEEVLTEAETAKPGALEPHAATANAELDKRIKVINEKLTEIRTQAGQEEKFKERNEAEKRYQEVIASFQKLKKKESDPSNPQDMDVTGDQWGECAEKLHNTERLLNEYPEISSPERRKELRTLLAYSRLYQELETARQAYEKGDFAAAINEYQSALHLLKEERTALDAIYNDAVFKVGQTVIMLNVSLELRKAVEAENHNDLRSSLGHYKKTLRIIRTSQADRDDNLKKLDQYIRSKIQEQSLAAAKSSNQEWWKENYEKIFKKKFPSSRNAPLSNPKIYFIKVQNGRLLYTIQCTEKKGIKLTLELTYQYDMGTGKWSPYHGKL
ncbi:rRNA-processing arch domain-containing protein [Candidatus Electrothrix marina]|uniref:rRNA-processing arch domain-containing protein n=1 Tax=Candidatus Electrothrix marina TaxID=1859130 RepID=A0A444JAH2_9BACT|nr:rRNA-processing arch domain-containing protein [Candidatus Electrothrix marina]